MTRDIFAKRPFVLDGAMGTELQAAGLEPGETPELWNITHPDLVERIHARYIQAGADAVYANTFGANRAKYHGNAPLGDVVAAGIAVARKAAGKTGRNVLVALDVGPTGRLLKPAGDMDFNDACEAFAEEIRLGAAAGADFIAIETMSDLYELKAAVVAAKENCNLPILATVALGRDGKLLTGADVECTAALLEALRVDAIGLNCGFGPDMMLPFVRRLREATRLPIAVKPNAGLPEIVEGRTVFNVGPEAFAKGAAELVKAGATIVGGCCGTTPEHIRAVADGLACPLPEPRFSTAGRTIITSGSRALSIDLGDSIIIGERINPTGKKKLKAALAEGDVAYVLREAVRQVEAGAHVLDVNTGVPGLDEAEVLDRTVQAIQSVTDIPLQIDSSDPKALELALRHYNGKALVNSVNGKEESLSSVLPIVAKYGGVVVALTLDENGIPPTAEGRLAIAKKIIERGAEYGLQAHDFIVDVLCLAVSADAQSANTILESLRLVRKELGVRTCLGVSNISFGLPERGLINATFYTMALASGLSAGIINPLSQDMATAYRAWRALTGRDKACAGWIDYSTTIPAAQPSPAKPPVAGEAAPSPGQVAESPLAAAVRRGLKADAAMEAKAALERGAAALELIDGGIVPALEEVGKAFEAGKMFLPQLLMAAEAAGAAFDVVRSSMPAQDGANVKGPIVLATVKGDIHDIGKNICRALLENYGFKVIDLGRDVPPERVLEAARRENARLVGLSALMTTTVGAMEETVKLIHSELPLCKVTVGGAVLTREYAAKMGADFYSKDAMALVRLSENIFAQ